MGGQARERQPESSYRRGVNAMTAYDNWLAYLDRLTDSSHTESERAMKVYLDAISIALSEVDFLPPKEISTLHILARIQFRLEQRVEDFGGIANLDEMLRLHRAMMRQVVAYKHQRLQREGRPARECVLEEPCGYHSGG